MWRKADAGRRVPDAEKPEGPGRGSKDKHQNGVEVWKNDLYLLFEINEQCKFGCT